MGAPLFGRQGASRGALGALLQAAERTTLASVMSASVGVPAWRMIATSSRLRAALRS